MSIQALNANASIQSSLLGSTTSSASSSSSNLLNSLGASDSVEISSEGQTLAEQEDLSSLASALPTLIRGENSTALLGTISLGSGSGSSFYNVLTAQNSLSSLSSSNSSSAAAAGSNQNEGINSEALQASRDQIDSIVDPILSTEEATESETTESETAESESETPES